MIKCFNNTEGDSILKYDMTDEKAAGGGMTDEKEMEKGLLRARTQVSPYELKFLLTCYYVGDGATLPYPSINVSKLNHTGADLIVECPELSSRYKLTAKGEYYINVILSTPFPVVKYEIPGRY